MGDGPPASPPLVRMRRTSISDTGRRFSWAKVEVASEQQFRAVASPSRFVALALFCSMAFLAAGSWLSLAPISNLAAARFDVSVVAVNQISTAFLYVFPASTALTLTLLETVGLRTCLVAAAAVNAGAIALRWAVLVLPVSPHAAFAVTCVSQLMAAYTDSCALNLSARVTMDWFPLDEVRMSSSS